jgi:hypothetical protein
VHHVQSSSKLTFKSTDPFNIDYNVTSYLNTEMNECNELKNNSKLVYHFFELVLRASLDESEKRKDVSRSSGCQVFVVDSNSKLPKLTFQVFWNEREMGV